MYLIAENGPVRYLQLVLDTPEDYEPPFESGAYTCLLWDTRGDADVETRSVLARRLIESVCIYVVCGGETCERWHDIIDETVVELQTSGEVRDDRIVMTTWHDGESSDEVAEFFVMTAVPPEGAVTQHVVIQIGQDWDKQNDLWTMVRGYALYG